MRISAGKWSDESAEWPTFTVEVESGGDVRDLWLSVERSVRPGASTDVLDGFVLAMLPTAMKLGQDLVVDGPMSERLAWSLNHYAIPLLATFSAMPNKIAVRAAEYVTRTPRPGRLRTGMGSSGGVDSLVVINELLTSSAPGGPKLDLLVFNNFSRRRFRGGAAIAASVERVRAFAGELGLQFCEIRSNISQLNQVPFFHSNVTVNAAGALMLQDLMECYAISAPYDFLDPRRDIGNLEPALVPMLSTPALQMLSLGSTITREEKTAIVADLDYAPRYLDVCLETRPGKPNCGQCQKCLRTMLTLEVLGRLDRFGEVFDLDAYRRARPRYLAQVMMGRTVILRKMRALLRSKGFEAPVGELAAGFRAEAAHGVRQFLARVGRRLAPRARPPSPRGS